MSPRTPSGRAALAIEARLRARMLPLVVLVAASVSLLAPTALFVFRVRELRSEARHTARHAATLVQSSASESPDLWRYNTPKLLDHVRAFRARPRVRSIVVIDRAGLVVDTGDATPVPKSEPFDVWGRAPIGPSGEPLGHVWVAVEGDAAWRDAALALLGFASLGLTLAGLVFVIPIRSVRRAERRIGQLVGALDDSRGALADFNEDLERQVAERSADLRDKERRLRDVSARATTLQEEQRRGIARELHDGVGQALTAARLQVQILDTRIDPSLRETTARTLSLLDEAIDEVRCAVADLAPAILDERGLARALSSWCDDFAERTGVTLERSIGPLPDRLSTALETTCYRIAQEALTNVTKHARARRVDLALRVEGGRLTLTVRDDGRGFDPKAFEDRAGHGLRGIRERVWLLGGELALESAPGAGTRLEAVLPLDAPGEPAFSHAPPRKEETP